MSTSKIDKAPRIVVAVDGSASSLATHPVVIIRGDLARAA